MLALLAVFSFQFSVFSFWLRTKNQEPRTGAEPKAERHEGMDSNLMKVALLISGDMEAAKKRMKPIRSSKALAPGVYFNVGTRMVERLHSPQRPALGNRVFRISKDPDMSVESIERKITGGG